MFPAPTRADYARFFSNVERLSSGCWIWTGAISTTGYGRFLVEGIEALAHRVACAWWNGAYDQALQVDHLCRIRACVNPGHLDAVTQQENLRRSLPHRRVRVMGRSEPDPSGAPTHPGEIFRCDFREAMDPPIRQAEAARRLGWSTIRMNQFELGNRGVTVENAIALGELTGTSPEFWMNLQARHDLWHALRKTKGKSVLAGEPLPKN